MNAARRMLTDTLQDVDQIVVGVDLMQPAGDDQALHDADLGGAEFGPAEIPVLATHRNDPQRPFEVVGIDRDIGVGQIDLERASSFAGIGEHPGERSARQQTLRFELPIYSGKELLDDRLDMH